jgi:phosphohistidine phosphatase
VEAPAMTNRRLYIVRHGIAQEHGTPGVADDDRRLTKLGRRRVRRVARHLKRIHLSLDRIISSPLPRAAETAAILAEVLGHSGVEFAHVLRDDRDATNVASWLGEQPDDRLMIVGHEPILSELVALLVTGSTSPAIVRMRKASVAALSRRPDLDPFDQLDWHLAPRVAVG